MSFQVNVNITSVAEWRAFLTLIRGTEDPQLTEALTHLGADVLKLTAASDALAEASSTLTGISADAPHA